MKDRDDELDALLEPLRGDKPTDLDMKRWDKALAEAAKRRPMRRLFPAWQLLAACLIGAVVGSWLVTKVATKEPCTSARLAVESSDADATIERIHIKLD